MKKLGALFKKTKKHEENDFVETGGTISAGKSKENLKYGIHDPKITTIPLSLGSVTEGEVEETCSCVITSNLQKMISFQSPSNTNIKNVFDQSRLRIDNVSSMSPSMLEESQDLLNQQMNTRRVKEQNSTYVLNINNSRCFHIGPQKIINIKSYTRKNLQKSSFIQMKDQWAEKFSNILEKLQESYEKPTEEVIAIIALGLKKKWKEFGRKLGFTECFLYETEMQNEKNIALTTYDMLKQYIFQFPNTTFGFIISILIETGQKSIIHEIIQQSEIKFFCNELIENTVL